MKSNKFHNKIINIINFFIVYKYDLVSITKYIQLIKYIKIINK